MKELQAIVRHLTSGAGGSSAGSLQEDGVFLNGEALRADAGGGVTPEWPFAGRRAEGGVVLQPLSYGFLVLDGAAPACL